MAQDAQGFVWLGTQDGPNRFDGFEFRPQAYSGSHSGIVPQAIADGLNWLRTAG